MEQVGQEIARREERRSREISDEISPPRIYKKRKARSEPSIEANEQVPLENIKEKDMNCETTKKQENVGGE